MNMQLNPRQRAMLHEMGHWIPTLPAPANKPAAAARAAPEPAPAPRATPPPAPMPMPAPAPAPGPSGTPLLHTPQALYPQADAAATPAELGPSWLVLLDSASAGAPLAGDAGRLLDNMLRAMRLHLHPRVFAAALAPAAPPGDATALVTLPEALTTLRPAMVLALGLNAARAALGSREPLGPLRARAHRLEDGTPLVVSHDPAYLLRAPEAKAAAWADLCRALALTRPES